MKHPNIPTEETMDRWGQFFSSQLTLATPDLPHDISERLRIARNLALAQRKPLVLSRTAKSALINNNGTLTAPADEGLSVWSILASAVPLLALVIGLMVIQWIHQDRITLEIAATDADLLTDELPPDAYTDAGFAQFLKQGLGTIKTHD